MVLRRELTLHKWKIGHNVGAVFSSDCLCNVSTVNRQEPKPCSACLELLKLHPFQAAILRPMPEEKSMKFAPYHSVRDLIESDDGHSPWLKFAQGCVDGIYNSDTLTRIVKALSLKNMHYDPVFDQFCDLLASISTHAYLTFKKHFVRSKLPRFRPDISALNVAMVADVLKKLNYTGPLVLSWDDTALEAALSIYQESKDVCLILGGVDGVIWLCVWVLSIPLPKIPPILIAAIARGSSTTAKELAAMHFKLVNILHEYNIHPIYFSSDGAEVEQAAQQIIAESAPSYLVYVIPNVQHGCQLVLCILIYFGRHPAIPGQDSKHGILMGARIIIIGFFTVFFAILRMLVFNILSPLFTRDIEKVDKQDDHAAAQMFSAATLEFQLNTYPGQTGLLVYLFVIGELIDTWQNCNTSHQDHAKIVLHAHFFLMAWHSHIVAYPDYSVNTQFISRESYNIFLTIYVLYFEHKLHALMLGAFGNLSLDEQANQTLAGYHHTYFTADDLDTTVLMQHPTDQELMNTSEYNFTEAAQLLKLVRINAEAMLQNYQDLEQPTRQAAPASAQLKSRPPQTLLELLTLYKPVPFKSSKDEESFETCEMALAAEAMDKSLIMYV
ncbi:hypothetical protein B0H10DRAFT_2159919 [Mycena sp. CBHHK59/15]|nr:hypothetical protein B0H10DRAFT_2159919 [Mycena sp. CBHHK59/15]